MHILLAVFQALSFSEWHMNIDNIYVTAEGAFIIAIENYYKL